MSESEIREQMRERLLHDVLEPQKRINTNELDGQWSAKFEQYMRNRLKMGAYRYGLFKCQKPTGYDNIGSAIKRLKLYLATGNQEHLVDAANLCMVEFVVGNHPHAHFDASDDGEHTNKLDSR